MNRAHKYHTFFFYCAMYKQPTTTTQPTHMSDKLVAVGAEWCGYSNQQNDAINGMADGSANNVHMVMCQDKNRQPIIHDDAWKNEVCTQSEYHIRGFPTWFKQDGAGAVAPIQHGGNGLHFMPTDDICTRLGEAEEPCTTDTTA